MITVVHKNTPTKPGVKRFYVGRPSPLGNPFTMYSENERGHVIRKYENWLRPHAVRAVIPPQNPPRVLLDEIISFARMGDVELACWCAPRACHADIIKAVIEKELKDAAH